MPVMWSDARIRCALEGAALASPSTPEMKAELTRFINTTENEEMLYEIYTGIHATITKGDYHSIEGKRLSVIPHTWALSEPDNKNNNESCITMNSFGQLADVSCDVTRPFVCYRPDTLPRPILNECGTIDPGKRLSVIPHTWALSEPDNKNNNESCITMNSFGQLADVSCDVTRPFVCYRPDTLPRPILNECGTIDPGKRLSVIPHTWALSEPDNKNNNESCITMNSFGQLADVSCDVTRPFVCYRPDTLPRPILNECGTIDPEYRLNTRTNTCYKFHKVPKTFSKAFLVCSAEGGHLAIINSELEATVLRDLFAKYPVSSLKGIILKHVTMIGFTDWDEHTEWRTIHGQTLKEAGYDRFGAGNPDNAAPCQYCGAIFRTGELDDMYCDKADAFICEKSPQYNAACT